MISAAVATAILVFGCAGLSLAQWVDLSTPEKTIAAYYSALNRADVAAFMATLLKPNDPRGMSFGVFRTYRIVEMKKILRSDMGLAGDVEVLVHADVNWPDRQQPMATNFLLRRVNDQWKIVEWALDSAGPD